VSQGLCLKACTLPSSLARFIHWLTAPSVTPRASAISDCFQPRSFNSKARKHLPSRQSLAWLDDVSSIVEFIIPTSLAFYAEIGKFIRNSLVTGIRRYEWLTLVERKGTIEDSTMSGRLDYERERDGTELSDTA
jgi:hypothetical protein